MVAASEKAGRLYMVSQSRRYVDNLHALRALVAEKTGPLGILNADFFIGAHFGGFRDEMASPLLLDMAIHTFDAARYISGADPVSVYCEEFNPTWSWYKGNAAATAIFEMTGNLRFTYRGCWCSDGQHTSWESEWRAVGRNGTAVWDGKTAPTADIAKNHDPGQFHLPTDRIAPTVAPTAAGRAIGSSLREFLHALDRGETPMGECHDNIKSLAMCFAAVESARVGKRIGVEW
jgi:predicted dehydrogenase